MYAFRFTCLTSITIPEGVTTISKNTFYGCTCLSSISIPEGVKMIEAVAFYGCSGLRELTIPESVTSIGEGAFSHCSNFIEIHAKMVIPPAISSVFYGVDKTICTLYVPAESVDAYKAADNWSQHIYLLHTSSDGNILHPALSLPEQQSFPTRGRSGQLMS